MQDEVRRLAAQMGLPNQGRKDSQGICFLGKVNTVPAFLVINVLGKWHHHGAKQESVYRLSLVSLLKDI
jgi:hypothetical protein